MRKRFIYLGEQWEAVGDGTGHGANVGSDHYPDISHWGVEFRPVLDETVEALRGKISDMDPNAVGEEGLTRELERRIILREVRVSGGEGRTIPALSAAAGIS